jgi:DNA-binding transcriptional MerR regulator
MFTIGKLAALIGISANALRYYGREGLILPASTSSSGYRLYDDGAVARLRFIKHAQRCGFTLAEIAELLTLQARDSACCNDVRRLTIEKKLQLETKIKAMQTMSKALDILIAECDDASRSVHHFSILGALEQVDEQVKKQVNGGRK